MRNAGAVIHTHSMKAMLVTLLYDDVFTCTHLEMIKGIKGLGYRSRLAIPIIENTPHERDLQQSMQQGADATFCMHAWFLCLPPSEFRQRCLCCVPCAVCRVASQK